MGTFTQTDTTFVVTWAVDELDESMWKALRSAVETHLALPGGQVTTVVGPFSGFAPVLYACEDARAARLEPIRLMLQGAGWLGRLDEARSGLAAVLEAFPLRANATGVNCHFAGPTVPDLAVALVASGHRFAELVADDGAVLALKTARPYLDGTLTTELALPGDSGGGGMVVRMNCHADHDANGAALARLSRYARIAEALGELAGRLYSSEGVGEQ
jgi:hypothetical protein